MNEQDRKALAQLVEQIEGLKKAQEESNAKFEPMRAALMDVPAGSSKDAKSLLEHLRDWITLYHRGRWAGKAAVWLVVGISTIGLAVQNIGDFWSSVKLSVTGGGK